MNPKPFQKVIRIIDVKSGVVLIFSDNFFTLEFDLDPPKINTLVNIYILQSLDRCKRETHLLNFNF